MMRNFHYETTREAFIKLFTGLLADPIFIDNQLAGPNHRFWGRDFIIEIDQPQSELDLHSVGFTKGRWTKFLTEYFDRDEFYKFLVFIRERRYNDAQEYGYVCTTRAKHSLGNCLLGLTIRTGRNPRVTLISRSCNYIPTGLLDLSLASSVAEYVADVCQTRYAKVIWQINHLQMSSYPATLFMVNLGLDPEAVLDPEIPFHASMLQCYKDTVNHHLPNIKYQFYKRYQDKIRYAIERNKSSINSYPFVPHLPQQYVPNWAGPIMNEYEEYDEQSPYGPEGGFESDIERIEYRNHTTTYTEEQPIEDTDIEASIANS